ncbi:MAG: 50S ribosomal protein L9 [Clostridia bacterium]|nr:50S ribosomal protein L9 [Clostridia bacterium]MDY3784789.1 50S ribosomal protein L9 [Eubacteriales bacterium]
MKLVLLADVKPLGKKNDIVDVSDGYAKNFLLPKKLAIIADAKAINEIKNKEAARLHAIEVEKAAANEVAKKLEGVIVKIYMTAGEDNRLFGSVTSKDIIDALEKDHGIVIDKKKVVLDKPIKAYGTYEINVKLYTGIAGKINVLVCSKQA